MAKQPKHIDYVEFMRRYLGNIDWNAGGTHRGNLSWGRVMRAQLSEMLIRHPDISNKQLATYFKCSIPTISRWREILTREGRSGYHQPPMFALEEGENEVSFL